jgi:hypothetical protein
MKIASKATKKPVGRKPQNPPIKNPSRKRTFDPEDKTAELLSVWESRNPGVRFGWMINRALQSYLQACAFKRGAA